VLAVERVGRFGNIRNLTTKRGKHYGRRKTTRKAFDTVALDDGDWDGPKHLGELLTYKSKHAAASIKVMRGSTVVFDKDYDGGKTVTIDGNVIHLPEGARREI
jgi:hypothetical protein